MKIIIPFILIVLTIGCSSQKPSPSAGLGTATEVNADVAKAVTHSADRIDGHVQEAERKTPQAAIPALAPSYAGIRSETDQLRHQSQTLDANGKRLERVTKEVTDLQATNAKLEADKADALKRALLWVIVASVIGLGVSAAMIAQGGKLGFGLGIGSAVTLGAAVLIAQYSFWLALGAAVLILGGIGWVVYQVVSGKRSVKELVATVEAVKPVLTPDQKTALFSAGGAVDSSQSSTTKAAVRRVRKTFQT